MKLGLFSVLFIVFLTLKLAGVIAWSWLWVTSPLWIGFALWVALFAFMVFLAVVGDTTWRKNYK